MKFFKKREPRTIVMTEDAKDKVMTFVEGICEPGGILDVETFNGVTTVTFVPVFDKETVNLGLMATVMHDHTIKFGRSTTWVS